MSRPRFRIEVDPSMQSESTVELAASVRELLAADRGDDPTATVAAAATAERAARAATDRALLEADEHLSRRAMAAALGRAHDAVNRRIRRIQQESAQREGGSP